MEYIQLWEDLLNYNGKIFFWSLLVLASIAETAFFVNRGHGAGIVALWVVLPFYVINVLVILFFPAIVILIGGFAIFYFLGLVFKR